MGKATRFILLAIAALIILAIVAVISLPLFLNADSFRTRIEATLSKSLGRQVSIGKLDLSIWSGGMVAENTSIADDPTFSTQPFVQAKSVKIRVEMLPLILHRTILIRGFSLESPQIQLLRAANGTWNYSTIGNAAGKSAQDADTRQTFPNLTVDKIDIVNGQITVGSAPGNASASPTRTYDQVNVDVTNFGFANSFPFSVSANLPDNGTLNITGKAGPVNQQDASATPLDAQLTLKHVEIGTVGILPADAGIAGLVDMGAKIQSNGQTLNAIGTATVANIKLAQNGQPSSMPLQLQFNIAQNEQAMTGQIQQTTITIGHVAINLAGTYQTSGPTTAIDLKVDANAISLNEIQAFLPVLGVHLPPGSQLRGGTLTTAITVSGSSASPVISGPVSLSNTQLAGFDLGSKLQTLSKLTGGRIGSATGSGTNIRSLSMNVQVAGGNIRTDNLALEVAGVGTAAGAGSVSAAGALNYNVVLKLTGLVGTSGGSAPAAGGGVAGLLGGLSGMIPNGGAGNLGTLTSAALKNGIPVSIGGTTNNPTFTPDLSHVATNAVQSLIKGNSKQSPTQSSPLGNVLGGLLGGRR